MVTLDSIEDIIDELGGLKAVGALTGRKSGVVWNWKDRKAFPTNTYVVMQAALRAKGVDAPASLWGMPEPERVHS